MIIVTIKTFLMHVELSILKIIKSIGLHLELIHINITNAGTTLKYKTCRDNHSIAMLCIHV